MKNNSILIIVVCLLFSCNQDSPLETSNIVRGSSILGIMLPSDPVFNKLVAQHDTTDFAGVIYLDYSNYSFSNTFPLHPLISGENSQSHASFFESDNPTNLIEIDTLYWENIHYINIGERVGDSVNNYGLTRPDLAIQYADSNHIQLDSNANIVGFDTNIYLHGNPVLSSLMPGDTISKSSSLALSWSNHSGHYVKIELANTDMFTTSGSSEDNLFNVFTNDDGAHSISSSDLSGMDDGDYFLTLLRYEPVFIDLSDGKKVCVLSQSEYQINIYLD